MKGHHAIISAVGPLPATITRSLTWDCGAEMALHQQITATGLPVYFAHPHSPWERGSNENLNRIVREYSPRAWRSRPIPTISPPWPPKSTTDPVRSTTGRNQRSIHRTPRNRCFHRLNLPPGATSR
jgi:hypothetical protein